MQTKEVKFKDGRKVTVKEISALEDTLAFRMVGKDFDEDNKFGGGVTVRSIQIALSIKEVDGKDVEPMRKADEVFSFMSKFTKREWNKLSEAYFELNEADDEGE